MSASAHPTGLAETRTRRVRVADVLPELVEHLDPDQRELAHRQLVADLILAPPGAWRPPGSFSDPGHLGLLVLDGLLTRDVILEKPLGTELVGQGDVLRPPDRDGPESPIPFGINWTILAPTRFAVMDPAFARVLGQWPAAMAFIMRGGTDRAHGLAITLAVSNLRRVDARLLVLLWYLADRWGRVTPDGILLPLRLTHETLARLVGAQRPSVTTALSQLEDDGRLQRTPERTWVLAGDPPETFARRAGAEAPID